MSSASFFRPHGLGHFLSFKERGQAEPATNPWLELLREHLKWDWIIALGEMGPRAKQAISQLKTGLPMDREKWVLAYVTNALKSISPETLKELEAR